MALLGIPLDKIAVQDLQRLIETKAAESLYIDYKAASYGSAAEQHREFLADISSFANTLGGDLVIGMTEDDGIPSGFNPFPTYPDTELRRLDDMALSGLQPRISTLRTRAVPSPLGGYVIVVRVPRSYNPPHRVIHSGSNRFWARSSASPRKYEPNVEELGAIFNEVPIIAERVRAFRTDRIAKIVSGDAPVVLAGGCLLVLHVVPYSAFALRSALSVAEIENEWRLFPPLGRTSGTHRFVNFDGFVVLSNGNPHEALHHSYAQVFRSGTIEAVATIDRNDGVVPASSIDKYCVGNTKKYVDALARFGVGYPMAVLASLLGVKGRNIESGNDGLLPPYGEQVINRDHLHFTECILESAPTNYTECALALGSLLEQVWNTAGFSSQQTLNNGRWLFGA